MDKRDGSAGLFLLGLGIFAFLTARHYPLGTLSQPDSALFPMALSALLIVFALISILKSLRSKKPSGWPRFGPGSKKLIPALAGWIAYVLVFDFLGYLLTTFLVLILFVRLVNPSWKAALTLSLICSVVSYFFCVTYLHTPLPQGFLPF